MPVALLGLVVLHPKLDLAPSQSVGLVRVELSTVQKAPDEEFILSSVC